MTSEVIEATGDRKNICRGKREEFYCFYVIGFLEQPVRVVHGKLKRRDSQ
jgi:hypothetical protein